MSPISLTKTNKRAANYPQILNQGSKGVYWLEVAVLVDNFKPVYGGTRALLSCMTRTACTRNRRRIKNIYLVICCGCCKLKKLLSIKD